MPVGNCVPNTAGFSAGMFSNFSTSLPNRSRMVRVQSDSSSETSRHVKWLSLGLGKIDAVNACVWLCPQLLLIFTGRVEVVLIVHALPGVTEIFPENLLNLTCILFVPKPVTILALGGIDQL